MVEIRAPYVDDALPLVSVVVVNFNGRESLLKCLMSVRKSDYPNFETVIVDNGSQDGSADEIVKSFGDDPRIKLVRCDTNLGLARARNIGAQVANGRFIAFLDNDAIPDARWLVEVVKVFTGDATIGACQSKLL